MAISITEYKKRSGNLADWMPNPFEHHPAGPWHAQTFEVNVQGVASLLARFRNHRVSRRHVLQGKDNGPRKQDTLSYWLWYQHHPGSEKWKLLGQRYWSVDAWRSWRRSGGRAFPKRKFGNQGLVSEHVVPKKKLKDLLVDRDPGDHDGIRQLLNLNLCCVVTKAEDRGLPSDEHPRITDPWLRYAKSGIVLLHNPYWTPAEIKPIFAHGLLTEAHLCSQTTISGALSECVK